MKNNFDKTILMPSIVKELKKEKRKEKKTIIVVFLSLFIRNKAKKIIKKHY